jgi:hypothetical protein
MIFSYAGIIAAVSYMAFAGYSVVKLAITKSFGGIWSDEFSTFVMTLPWSAFADRVYTKMNIAYDAYYVRIAMYSLAVLFNAFIIYFVIAYVGVLTMKIWQAVK